MLKLKWTKINKIKIKKKFYVLLAIIFTLALFSSYLPKLSKLTTSSISVVSAWGDGNVEIWWPTNGAKVSGSQPFKAILNGQSIDKYKMVWQVDDGKENEMQNNFSEYPHKESVVDLSGWTWKGAGPYTVKFTAYDFSGNKLGSKYESLYINQSTLSLAALFTSAQASPEQNTAKLDIWWPTNNSVLSGQTALKAMLENYSVNDYSVYWQIEDGPISMLATSYQDYPHKETMVDVTSWNWKGAGPYTLTFIAKDNSARLLAQTSVTITTNNTLTKVDTTIQKTLTQTPNNIAGAKLFVNPNTEPAIWAREHRYSEPAKATLMDKVARGAQTQWFGNWNSDVKQDVNNFVTTAINDGSTPTIVAYNIPNRDCGGYSAGNIDADGYKKWISQFALGINGRKVVVILEPDATALTNCLSQTDLQTRYGLLQNAVSVLKAAGALVYIDAGHPGWVPASDMSGRLKNAGIAQADGFTLNVSNFVATDQNVQYGQSISAQVGGKHFIIDTGRNGSGASLDYQWCNPSGRSLGQLPTTSTGIALVDAYLWVKGPWGSDGYCNGGPAAGVFFPDYALGLAQRASW